MPEMPLATLLMDWKEARLGLPSTSKPETPKKKPPPQFPKVTTRRSSITTKNQLHPSNPLSYWPPRSLVKMQKAMRLGRLWGGGTCYFYTGSLFKNRLCSRKGGCCPSPLKLLTLEPNTQDKKKKKRKTTNARPGSDIHSLYVHLFGLIPSSLTNLD